MKTFNLALFFNRWFKTVLIVLVVLLSSALFVSQQAAASIAQGYVTSDSELTVGMAASLDNRSQENVVVRTNIINEHDFVGIVTTEDNNQVTLKNDTANVIITTSGDVVAFVSDVNGEIRSGDYLSASPLQGILVKAPSDAVFVVGTALADFDTSTANQTTLRGGGGELITARVSPLRMNIKPTTLGDTQKSTVSFLQVIGEGIIGRTISNWQVATVLIIFLMLLIVEGSLMYGAIHGTIISLGRNPLAKEALYRQLLQALITVFVVFIFGAAIIYAVLQI